MEKKVDRIDDNVSKIAGSLTDFILEVKTNYITKKEAEKKFADKLSEKIIYTMVGIVTTAVLGAVLAFVITK